MIVYIKNEKIKNKSQNKEILICIFDIMLIFKGPKTQTHFYWFFVEVRLIDINLQ